MLYRLTGGALAPALLLLVLTVSGAFAETTFAQTAAPGFDQRTVAQQVRALSALVELREAEIRAIAADMKGLDQSWRGKWCLVRPADCGIEPKPAEAPAPDVHTEPPAK